MRAASVGALGATGAAVLAACGETQIVEVEKIVTRDVEVIKEVPVEKIVEKVVTRDVEKIVEVEKVIVEKAAAAPAQAGPVTITFSTDHAAGPRGKAMAWALAAFRDSQTNISVKVLPAQDLTKMAIDIASGTGPDTALISGRIYQILVRDGGFSEFSGVVAKDGINMDDYVVIPEGHPGHHPYEGSLLFWGDEQYGFPYQIHAPGWSFNLDLLGASGVDFPGEDWDWDDCDEMLKQLTDPGAGQFGMMESPDWVTSWAGTGFSAGAPFWYDADFSKTIFDHDGWMQTFEWLDRLTNVDKVNVSPSVAAEIRGEFGNPFVAGKAAIHHGSMYYGPAGAVAQIGRRFEWSLGLPPKHPGTGEAGTMHEDQSHYVMNSADRQGTTEQAARWLFFAASEAVSKRIGIDRGNFPTHRAAYTAPGTLAGPPEGMENWGKSLDLPANHGMGVHSEWIPWRDAGFWKYINDLLLNGEMGAAEAAQKAAADSDAVMDKAGWPPPVTKARYYD
jgi:ABC-type glycerol-3-phosphate transport system substrate-binding protein